MEQLRWSGRVSPRAVARQCYEPWVRRGRQRWTGATWRTTGSLYRRFPRYVLVLNPDTEIVGDALAQFVAYLDAHPRVAVAGPQLRYADGSIAILPPPFSHNRGIVLGIDVT